MNWRNRIALSPADEGGSAGSASAAGGGAGSGAGGAAAPADGGGAGAEAGAGAASFADTLPEDLRTDAVFRDIKDLAGLARSYQHAAKMVGMDKARLVPLPSNPDDTEGWGKVYGALGRPEAPDKYELKPADGMSIDAKVEQAFRGKAHELGISQRQAAGLYEWWNGTAKGAIEARDTAVVEGQRQALETLKTDWGQAFDQNMRLAKEALGHYAGADLKAQIDELRLGDNPAVIKLFAKLGKQLQEDGIIGRSTGDGIPAPTEAQQQINALRNDKEFTAAYYNGAHPGHADAIAKMERLFKLAFPENRAA